METVRRDSLSLEAKEQIALTVIKDALRRFNNGAIVWSAGKDSTVALHLLKRATEDEGLDMLPAIFVDHGDHFPETLKMIDEVSKAWNFRVIVARNDDALSHIRDGKIYVSDLNERNRREIEKVGFKGDSFEYSLETDVGNHILKTVPLLMTVEKYQLEYLIIGIRWDENPARAIEVFISKRENPNHYRVHPILPFTERDVWTYTFKYNLPIHPKYREGYRSIDGIRDTKKFSDKPAWEQDLENTKERMGRSQDKENMMERLRKLGYM